MPHAKDECMRCSKEPEIEIMWAGHRARAWFCEEHAEEFKSEKDDDEITKEREVPNGEVAEDWSDGPIKDNAKKEAFRLGFQKEAGSIPGAAATGILPFGDTLYQGGTAEGEHKQSTDWIIPLLGGAAMAAYTGFRNKRAIKELIARASEAAKSDRKVSKILSRLRAADKPEERQRLLSMLKEYFVGGTAMGAAEGVGYELANRYRHEDESMLKREKDTLGLLSK